MVKHLKQAGAELCQSQVKPQQIQLSRIGNLTIFDFFVIIQFKTYTYHSFTEARLLNTAQQQSGYTILTKDIYEYVVLLFNQLEFISIV